MMECDHQTMIQKHSSSSHLHQTRFSSTNLENDKMNPEVTDIDPSMFGYSIEYIPSPVNRKRGKKKKTFYNIGNLQDD